MLARAPLPGVLARVLALLIAAREAGKLGEVPRRGVAARATRLSVVSVEILGHVEGPVDGDRMHGDEADVAKHELRSPRGVEARAAVTWRDLPASLA